MKKKKRCRKCHFSPCRCEDLDAGYFGSQSPKGWPMKSEALAVHPDQRAEAIASAKRQGVSTYFDRMGRPVFTSARHRAAYCKAYGFRDRNGGYSDYTGHSRKSDRQCVMEESRGIHKDL